MFWLMTKMTLLCSKGKAHLLISSAEPWSLPHIIQINLFERAETKKYILYDSTDKKLWTETNHDRRPAISLGREWWPVGVLLSNFWTGNVLFLDLGDDYMIVFTLWEHTELFTWLVYFDICVIYFTKKFTYTEKKWSVHGWHQSQRSLCISQTKYLPFIVIFSKK